MAAVSGYGGSMTVGGVDVPVESWELTSDAVAPVYTDAQRNLFPAIETFMTPEEWRSWLYGDGSAPNDGYCLNSVLIPASRGD